MKTAKKLISLVMVMVTLVLLAVPASAASSVNLDATTKDALPNLSNISIRTYAKNTSGKIYCYTDSNLKTRGSGWIDLKNDECTILKVANSGKALYIKYPIGNGKTTCRWFSSEEFLGVNMATKWPVVTVTKKMTTYKRSNGGATYGYAATGDKVYVIGMDSNYVCIVYSLATGGYKIGYVKHQVFQNSAKIISDIVDVTSSFNSSNTSFTHPMKNYHKNYTQWGVKPSYRNGYTYQYHAGVDYMSNKDSAVYAFTSGTVAETGYNKANGYYIYLKHTISGVTVYSFYAHLSKISVTSGQTVSTGEQIGTVGQSGSSANGTTHLHFAVVDYLYSGGGLWGYVTKFAGDKVKFTDQYKRTMTFYNPYYIIANGKLP